MKAGVQDRPNSVLVRFARCRWFMGRSRQQADTSTRIEGNGVLWMQCALASVVEILCFVAVAFCASSSARFARTAAEQQQLVTFQSSKYRESLVGRVCGARTRPSVLNCLHERSIGTCSATYARSSLPPWPLISSRYVPDLVHKVIGPDTQQRLYSGAKTAIMQFADVV